MNKILEFTRVTAVSASLLAAATTWADAVQVGSLFYELDPSAKTAYVTKDDSYKTMTSVDIPASITVDGVSYAVTKVGAIAFQNCTQLSSVTVAEGITAFGDQAFYACAFETIALPSTLQSTGIGTFSRCSKLKSIKFPEGFTSIGDQSFYSCMALTEAQLPSTLRNIGNAAFYDCKALDGVTVPDNISTIQDNAFYGCSSLSSFVWPSSITQVSPAVFYNCSSLANVTLPETVTSLGSLAFRSCAKLRSIQLPSKLENIGPNSFDRSGLTSITIPATVKVIGKGAFYLCTYLNALDIPAGVEEIGSSFITGCSSLKKVNIAEGNKKYADIDGVVFNKEKTVLHAYPAGRTGVYTVPEGVEVIYQYSFNQNNTIAGIVFPEGLKEIGLSAFAMCNNLSGTINLPSTLEKIGDTAFFLDGKITEIFFPNTDGLNVAIGNNAFGGVGVKSMLFPEGLDHIGITDDSGVSVFGSCASCQWISLPSTLTEFSPIASSCANLKAMYCFATVPPVLKGENIISTASVVKVPKGTAKAYQEAWAEFYPNMTFDDVLPLPPTVTVNETTAILSWERFIDELYTGSPVRYVITLDDVEVGTIEENFTETTTVTYTFDNLTGGNHTYAVKGFSAKGEFTMYHKGEITVSNAGIESVADSKEPVAVEYFDLTGAEVSHPAANGLYIVRTTYTDGTITTAKQIVK